MPGTMWHHLTGCLVSRSTTLPVIVTLAPSPPDNRPGSATSAAITSKQNRIERSSGGRSPPRGRSIIVFIVVLTPLSLSTTAAVLILLEFELSQIERLIERPNVRAGHEIGMRDLNAHVIEGCRHAVDVSLSRLNTPKNSATRTGHDGTARLAGFERQHS